MVGQPSEVYPFLKEKEGSWWQSGNTLAYHLRGQGSVLYQTKGPLSFVLST